MTADYQVVHCNVAATQLDDNGRYAITHNMKVEKGRIFLQALW